MVNTFFKQTYALTVREMKHWYRSKVQIFMALIQPLIWLGLFGTMMGGMMEMSIPGYFNALAMGMIIITALTTAMNSGISLVWDRRLGFLDKIRAAPIPRGAIPLSRVLAATLKALFQCTIVFIIALLLGLEISSAAFGAWSIPVLIITIVGISMTFASVFVALGLVIKNQEAFMGINMLLMMPLMFISGAMFPTQFIQNDLLGAIATANPLTYAADALRRMFIDVGPNDMLLSMPDVSWYADVTILLVVAAVVTSLGMIFARRALRS
jgi:ABC-type polysaccharide/polyol phosphate export systems, permease component